MIFFCYLINYPEVLSSAPDNADNSIIDDFDNTFKCV